MIHYPLEFACATGSNAGINTTWEFLSEQGPIHCAVPKEFEGPGGALSPEDLFAQALLNCFVATFKVYAEHSRFTYGSLKVKGLLTVDMDSATKKPVMKRMNFQVQLIGASNEEKARLLVRKAFESGFVLNSVKTVRDYSLELC